MIEFVADEIERLADELENAAARAVERTRAVVGKTGHDTVRDSQIDCPVDTGHLKSTIGVDFDPDALGFEAGAHASYAGYVHFGTRYMAPRPYFLPHFDRRVDLAVQALEQIVGDPWGRAV